MAKKIGLMFILFGVYAVASADITMTFEEFVGFNGSPISTFYSGISFTAATSGQEWVAGEAQYYNTSSWPSGTSYWGGDYWVYDDVFAWTESSGGDGKIAFDDKNATFVEIGYCSYSAFYLEAYDEFNNLLDSDTGVANLRYTNGNESGPGTLRVDSLGTGIAYVLVHDSGNFWCIDNVRTDATGIIIPPSVPAPAAILLAGMGTGLVGWLRRRRAL